VRVIKDIGLAGISFIGVVIALFLGVNLLSKELDRKTVYFVIPKPIERWEFLLGKFIGLFATLVVLSAVMVAILAGIISFEGGLHGVAMVRAEVLIVLELGLITAIAMLFSSFSSPYLSAMFTASLWVVGRNSAELRALAAKLDGTPSGTALEVAASVLPDFHLFYISGGSLGGDHIVSIHEGFVGWGYVIEAAAYALVYCAVCLLVAASLFAKRDLT
jgi:ABC-type transport system involved in multi-copper enzyme maturation permease subunit